jgi:hypothetical protein
MTRKIGADINADPNITRRQGYMAISSSVE